MRKDLEARKEEIIELINIHTPITKICNILNCKNDTLKRLFNKWDITYTGNRGSKGYSSPLKKSSKVFLFKNSSIPSSRLKNLLFEESLKERKCEICGITEWMGKSAPLQLDHIDGNHNNNEFCNLRILCPNCHAQTDTYAGKNIKARTTKISDAEILDSLQTNKSILSAIKSLGLNKGGNYVRFVKLAETHGMYHLLENLRTYHVNPDIIAALKEIDFSKNGWVGKASKIIGISPQKTRKWINVNIPELSKDMFTRNSKSDKID